MTPSGNAFETHSTIEALLQWGENALAPSAESPRRDSEILLGHCGRFSRSYLHSHGEATVEKGATVAFKDAIERRQRGEPIAYIVGYREFWSLQLKVTPATLIPRPETELLVEYALTVLDAEQPARVLDLGTGSGAIALALAKERPRWTIVASDISEPALNIARENARELQIDNVEFVASNWFEAITPHFDMIVSNPPYIAPDDPHLAQGDLVFEPQSALTCGDAGLAAIKTLSKSAANYLLPAGWLLIEHGYNQMHAVRGLLDGDGWRDIIPILDYSENPRLVIAKPKCP